MLSFHFDYVIGFRIFGVVGEYIVKFSFSLVSIDTGKPINRKIERDFNDGIFFSFFEFFCWLTPFGVVANESLAQVERMQD